MADVTKEFEIELDNGNVVNVSITVEGDYEANYGADADGNRGVGMWFISDHSYEILDDSELSDSETAELAEKVEEKVSDEDWDFDTAQDDEEVDSYDNDDYF
jgi:hypothetical protein